MTPAEILAEVLRAGGRLIADPERPRLLVPPHLKPLVLEHHEALQPLVREVAARTADQVRDRVQAFKRQLEQWAASAAEAIPLLVVQNAPVGEGLCVSCGQPLEEGRNWRCLLCEDAVRIVLKLPAEG